MAEENEMTRRDRLSANSWRRVFVAACAAVLVFFSGAEQPERGHGPPEAGSSVSMTMSGAVAEAQTYPVTQQGLGARHNPGQTPADYRETESQEPDSFSYIFAGVLTLVFVGFFVILHRSMKKRRRRIEDMDR